MVAFKTAPALQWVVVPCAASQILIDVKVSVRQNVQAGTLLIADYHCQRILEFLTKMHIEHACVQRAAQHAGVKPARARKRAGGGTRKNQVGSSGEHRCLPAKNCSSTGFLTL